MDACRQDGIIGVDIDPRILATGYTPSQQEKKEKTQFGSSQTA